MDLFQNSADPATGAGYVQSIDEWKNTIKQGLSVW